MYDTVVECLVSTQKTGKEYAARIAIIAVDIVISIVGLIIAAYLPIFMVIAVALLAAAIAFTYLVFRNTDIEYEYAFFEGELAIDKVMGKKVRKKLKRFNMGKMDMMAPENSARLGGLRNRKMYDYSSHDTNDMSFVAVVYDENNASVELKFTPNEELLNRLERAYPRKIYHD